MLSADFLMNIANIDTMDGFVLVADIKMSFVLKVANYRLVIVITIVDALMILCFYLKR